MNVSFPVIIRFAYPLRRFIFLPNFYFDLKLNVIAVATIAPPVGYRLPLDHPLFNCFSEFFRTERICIQFFFKRTDILLLTKKVVAEYLSITGNIRML
jgi:hypothetical protein